MGCPGHHESGGFSDRPFLRRPLPLELLIAVGRVEDLKPGIYRYAPPSHTLRRQTAGEQRPELATAAFGQDWVRDNAMVVIIAADFQRTLAKCGQTGFRYVHMEAGHAAENLFLQAVVLGLDTVAVGSFDGSRVRETLDLPEDIHPLLLMPIGKAQANDPPGDPDG